MNLLATGPESRWRLAWVPLLVLAVAAVLRVLGLRTELWMDELLSLRLVGALESPLGVFTAVHHDNNHYLNSLWLYGAGPDARSWLMRLPPVVLGTALVALASVSVADRGRRTAFAAAILTALSYPLIHYSSEARGYGYVLFFALLSYLLFRKWLADGRIRWAVAYSLSASLGFLSHLGFVTVFAALVAWSVADAASVPGRRVRRLMAHMAAHALPVVVLGTLFVVDLRELRVVGGPPVDTLTSWLNAAGLLAGSAPTWLMIPVAALAIAAILFELRQLIVERSAEALFFTTVFLLPLAYGFVSPHAYRRYYLTALLFALLLLAAAIGRLLGAGTRGRRRFAIALLLAVIAVNLYQTSRFLSIGRGDYRGALAAMVAGSEREVPTVAGDLDMGHILSIDYYAPRIQGHPSFIYHCSELTNPGCERVRPSREAGQSPPEYFLLTGSVDPYVPPQTLDIDDMAVYVLEGVYPKYGLSSVTLAVYRAVR